MFATAGVAGNYLLLRPSLSQKNQGGCPPLKFAKKSATARRGLCAKTVEIFSPPVLC